MSHFNTAQPEGAKTAGADPQSPSPAFQVKRRKYDSRSVARYVTNLQYQSKEAYDVFRQQAIDSGLYK